VFTRKTVLVVGAGANFEVGMPLGAGLVEIIAGSANLRREDHDSVSGDRRAWELISQRFSDSNERRQRHLVAARKIAEGIYGAGSIDNYIDTHSADEAVATVGKLFIALALLRKEAKSDVYVDPSNIYNRLDLLRAKDSWLDPLRTMLFERVNAPNIDSMGKNLTIISFNYDRVVEQYLSQALQRVYHLEPDAARNVVETITILRPYGSLGRLPVQAHYPGPSEVAFGADPEEVDCWSVSQNIKTYSEQVEDTQLTSKIDEAMSSAEQLVFLGFGFHPQNMQIISVSRPTKMPQVYASGVGIFAQEHDELRRRIIELYPAPPGEFLDWRKDLVNIEVGAKASETLWMHRRNLK
jgi:hypothetical protein